MSYPLSTKFQVVQGVWSPADGRYTYVVAEEFDSYKEAKRCCAKVMPKDDPTIGIVEVKARLLWRAKEPPHAAPDWATGAPDAG